MNRLLATQNRRVVDPNFTHQLPKIELHAHLTGSISPQILHQIWAQRKTQDSSFILNDPLIEMSTELEHFNVSAFFPLVSTLSVLNGFMDDGVRYLELRTTPRVVQASGITKTSHISTVLDCIANFRLSTKDIMPTYLILSIDRRNTLTEAMETVDLAIQFRSQGVVGLDLCGNPSKGNISIFRPAFEKAKAAGLQITLHFAEIPASSTEEELRTLLSYEPGRLGHVIHVPTSIMQEITTKRIGLELCLSCNVNAKLISGGFGDHHFGQLWATESPVILCTDDVGVFGSPLSNECFLAAKHFDLSKEDLIQLMRRSATAIFSGESEKKKLLHILDEFQKSMQL
ncbi:Metallo-dependent hydrolase [Microthyrium microscopicum]|uniref:Metallo-dependent hydrolase n=1 Tax=Microthyrium microscopicum TaxID=703497 RepID=A0A6A6UH55_9PEZI|nr:Metallo-dependent hydrolase [Microthyrium microscopicum]